MASVAAFAGAVDVARAVVPQPGDILVNNFSGNNVQLYSSDGTLKQTFTGTGTMWEGASVTPGGLIVTTRRTPAPGVNFYDSTGAEVATFDTPEVALRSGDVSVFADGTLAVIDQTGGPGFPNTGEVELYTPQGTHLLTLSVPRGPLGNFVASDDTLWVPTQNGPIYHFNESGTLLGSFASPLAQPVDLVVDPSDGTLFVVTAMTNAVEHLSPTGTLLGSFPTSANIATGIGMAPDGSLYVTGQGATSVYHYNQGGTLLDSFPITNAGMPLFLTVITPEPASASLLALAGGAGGATLLRRGRRRRGD